jgi:hypothetical protein
MTKKLIIGTILLAGVVFLSAGTIFASEEVKPWESMIRFRGRGDLSAQELGMSKEAFHAYRNESRDQHREARMEARQERLMAAFEKGCITEEEMASKMQTRKGRFSGQ